MSAEKHARFRALRKHLLLLLVFSVFLPVFACAPASPGSEDPSEEPSGSPSDADGPGFVIAKDGVLLCDIVVPDSPSAKETAAANDLRKYLGKMIGTAPDVVRERKAEIGRKHNFIGATGRTASAGIEKPSG